MIKTSGPPAPRCVRPLYSQPAPPGTSAFIPQGSWCDSSASRNRDAGPSGPSSRIPDERAVALSVEDNRWARASFADVRATPFADRLFASVNTVRTQHATLYRKLKVDNRDDAQLRLHDLGIDPYET